MCTYTFEFFSYSLTYMFKFVRKSLCCTTLYYITYGFKLSHEQNPSERQTNPACTEFVDQSVGFYYCDSLNLCVYKYILHINKVQVDYRG